MWPISNTDGNIFFDTVCKSKDVLLVERYINDYQWYKHFLPTMKVDNILKSHNTFFITFMSPILRNDNKRIPIMVVFDFSSGVMKMKHMSLYLV